MTADSVLMQPSLLIPACKALIGEIEQARNDYRDQLIKKRMSRWFFPPKTREAAIASLQRAEAGVAEAYQWECVRFHRDDEEKVAQNMLLLAQYAIQTDQMVTVSGHTLGILKKYLG